MTLLSALNIMTENDYQLAWGIYAVSALGCLLAWFYFTSWMWRYLREPLRILVAIILLTPTVVDPTRDLYAPAIAMTVMDILFEVSNDAWRSVADLLMYGAMAFAVYAVFALGRWLIIRSKRNAQHVVQRQSDQDNDAEPSFTMQGESVAENHKSQVSLVAQR